MVGTTAWLLLAAAFFVGIHLIPATPLRGRLIAMLSPGGYLALFSAASAGGLAWMIWAFGAAPRGAELWQLGVSARYAALVLVALAFLLIVPGLTIRNPTVVGAQDALADAEPAKGVLRITRHPFLWGVVLWSVAHLLANSDARSLILFGSLGALAFSGTFLIDSRVARKRPEDWQRYSSATSRLPFAAILARRNRLAIGEIGWWRIVLAALLFALLLHFHAPWFGAYPLP